MSLPNIEGTLEHFGISATDNEDLERMSLFDSGKIERIGAVVARLLEKGKGRAVIDYDPTYPYTVLRVYTDFSFIPDAAFKVTFDGERYLFESVPTTDSKDPNP